jgi:hypothetical protein
MRCQRVHIGKEDNNDLNGTPVSSAISAARYQCVVLQAWTSNKYTLTLLLLCLPLNDANPIFCSFKMFHYLRKGFSPEGYFIDLFTQVLLTNKIDGYSFRQP